MKQYLNQLSFILENGSKREDRTGTGTIGVFGMQARYNLSEAFPAMTTKRLYWKGVVHELLWMLDGNTNIKYLVDNDVHIWDDDAFRGYCNWYDHNTKMAKAMGLNLPHKYSKDEFIEHVGEVQSFNPDHGKFKMGGATFKLGELGPVYGEQWRNWENGLVDQVYNLISGLKKNPYSRRHIITAWNPSEVDDMVLPPCHCLAQFYVCDGKLSCQMYQRSADMFLGVPFNIASYSLLTHMIAQVCELNVGEFIHSIGDAHIYLNHIEQVKEQLSREPKELPTLSLNPQINKIGDFKFEDIGLNNYKSYGTIKAPLSVGV